MHKDSRGMILHHQSIEMERTIYTETQAQICRTLCDFIFIIIFWINIKRKQHEYLIEISRSNRMEEKRTAEEQIT
jgi:hypothetical protein